ncbi:hypothetical protein TRFO_34970 [Tritrichomonas foetus]|uniref:Uncharacterized protein n=1 Tax=Tritrichomonas foetus TaxID=1144522 RepID=A0A1J4JHJ2_9EUKA|nr:hypothetical protein TRFO_34970 [Tritrichomonas foetus]|eukprot:OHS98606.1 hypothetical protein TRFO_34970 [Tritrichomonas foetus]
MTTHRKYSSFKYAQFEKMLDDWFGTDRNGGSGLDVITDYNDPRVCKLSLAGVCPFTIFKNTRLERQPCRYEVCPCPPNLREKYLLDRGDTPTTYDQQLYEILDAMLATADKKIAFSKSVRNSEAAKLQEHPELKKKDAQIADLIEKSRQAGINNEIAKAMAYLDQAELIREQRTTKEFELMKRGEDKESRIHVCEVCTAVIKQSDMEGRMEEHVAGRQHKAYLKLRETFENLKSAGIINKRRSSRKRREGRKGSGPVRRLQPLEE